MSTEHTQTTGESFTEYADRMHEKRRSVAVFVEGDLAQDPPLGGAMASRVAHYLTGDGESVANLTPGNVTDEDRQKPEGVGAVQTRLLPGTEPDDWRPVQQRLLSRVPQDTDVVVLVDHAEVPWFLKDLCDVRVTADSIDGDAEFYRAKLDHWSGDVYYHKMDGFHGETDE